MSELKKAFIIWLSLLGLTLNMQGAEKPKVLELNSPDKKIAVKIEISEEITWSVWFKGMEIISPSAVALNLENGVLGINPVLVRQYKTSTDRSVPAFLYKKASIKETFNELKLDFQGDYSLIFRAYDNAAALRFETWKKGDMKIMSELFELNVTGNPVVWHAKNDDFNTSYESEYKPSLLSEISEKGHIELPFVMLLPSARVAIFEADLFDYPALFIDKGLKGLTGNQPGVPVSFKSGGYNDYIRFAVETADHIAVTKGTRTFPWRIVNVVDEEYKLLDNDMVYLLSSPTEVDFSWVKPGMVLFDWWHAMRLYNVGFKSGINTDTYKYYIDYAAKNNIPYVNIDEGWSDFHDLTKISKTLDMEFLTSYAKEKNVGLLLWAASTTLEKQMEAAMDKAVAWGVKGLKVDFFQREDQPMINLYEKIAHEAAKRKLLIDFHGAKKPTGLYRKYPNILNQEAVRGLEYNKIEKSGIGASPEQAAVNPFIRMLVGFMDYTPGGLTNANKNDFRVVFDRPMTVGTRMQQVALFVVYFAPLTMMADSPSAYEKEPEILKLITSIPTVWDETLPVAGEIGEYAVIARRSGNSWFVAGINGDEAREIDLLMPFPHSGLKAELWKDGPNSALIGNDYIKEDMLLREGDKIKIKMEPGGGFLLKAKHSLQQ